MDYIQHFKRIKNVVFLALVLFTILGLIGQLTLMSNVEYTYSVKQIQECVDRGADTGNMEQHLLADKASVYKRRKTQIQTVCKQLVEDHSAKSSHYCTLPATNNISYCKVPKCGSTLWIQIFNILTYGVENIDTYMRAKRFDLHRNQSCKTLQYSLENPLSTIIVSRDPYSRLYSAYIDKSYIMFRTMTGGTSVRQLGKNCSGFSDLTFETFQNFLDRILIDNDSDFHWRPIYNLCLPCGTDVFLQVKLEEFSKDMKFVFSQIGFNDELQNILRRLTVNKIDSLAGIAATVFLKNENKTCLPKVEAATRMWHSFQIQGYVRFSSFFPQDTFLDLIQGRKPLSETDAFMQLVSAEMSDHPMDKDDSLSQRRTMLVNAYSDIKPETIASIQNTYKLDFLMFGYSMLPPIQ